MFRKYGGVVFGLFRKIVYVEGKNNDRKVS